MAQIELNINGRKYVISAKDSEEHLTEVAKTVQDKIEQIRKQTPTATYPVATLLAAFDFASLAMKGKKGGEAYREAILKKAHSALEKIETELAETQPPVH